MKKEYIAPQLLAYTVEAGQILAGSDITRDGDNAIVTPGNGTYSGDDWASRRRGTAWDDEDDY